ncbi:alpha/beta fold hydrolase [Terrarubrum flagellatum]|uniref:alpha/beta fold hydrolase n=1 Tax=Terrirubrum flagellatum TaxID=2895980 RepID=UPI0031451973
MGYDAPFLAKPAATAEPVIFDGQFGWLHCPAREGAHAEVIVMCSALGVEMMCAHAGWRRLAEMFAEAGIPALRFDYPGTGDSSGDDQEPDRVSAWLDGVDAAINWARRETGAPRATLIGLRFGALLAAHVAARRDDIAAIAALAPVVSGRAHMRELAALAQLTASSPEATRPRSDAGDLIAGGFLFSAETQAAAKALDMRKLGAVRTRQALLISRDSDAENELARKWRADGAHVELASFVGYDAFVSSPTTTRTPDEVWRRIVEWRASAPADRTAGKQPTQDASIRANGSAEIVGDGWREEPLQFGRDARLFGILTRPAPAALAADETRPAIIILNAGRNHHIGWGRGAVEIARHLARRGETVLRMDAAGVGDSPAWPDGPAEVLYAPEQRDDLSAALDELSQRGFARFFVVGACAGAYLALHGALSDVRISGFALVNLLRFHWGPDDDLDIAIGQQVYGPTSSYLARLTDGGTWKRLLSGDIAVAGIAGAMAQRGARAFVRVGARMLERFGLSDSETSEAARWMRQLDARDVKMLLIYSTDDPGLAELESYFGPGGRQLLAIGHARIAQLPGADHNLSQPAARQEAIRLIEDVLS